MLDDIFNSTDNNFKKCITSMKNDFSKLILDKANLNLISNIKITYYDEKYPLSQLAVILLENANAVSIKPFDKKNLSVICNEIINLNLDLNPLVAGDNIKINFPKLTQERRDFFVKKVKKISEDAKISIRNIRRQSNQKFKLFLKDNKISKDDEKLFLNKIQNLTDKCINEISLLTAQKEKSLLTI